MVSMDDLAILEKAVLTKLLDGDHPNLVLLREQVSRAAVSSVELSGVGFFVDFRVPDGMPLTDPLRLVGGGAEVSLSCAPHGAGCVLFVDEGRLAPCYVRGVHILRRRVERGRSSLGGRQRNTATHRITHN